jgi:hypothetical protein
MDIRKTGLTNGHSRRGLRLAATFARDMMAPRVGQSARMAYGDRQITPTLLLAGGCPAAFSHPPREKETRNAKGRAGV